MNRDLMNLWRAASESIRIPDELLPHAHPAVLAQWEEGLISSVEFMDHIGYRIAFSLDPRDLQEYGWRVGEYTSPRVAMAPTSK